MTDVAYTAAWVPDDDPERSWDEAAELAVDWVLQEAQRQGAKPLLVTPTQQQWTSGPNRITWFARTYSAVTPRSSRPARDRGPVLAYVPDYELMHLAAGYARGSSLAVVESAMHPLVGWAMAAGAVNLLTGKTTADTLSEAQRTALDRVHFYGNNGWTRGFGRDQATRILRDLSGRETAARDIILGYMVAKGHNGKAVDRLAKIIDSLG
ncbi:hypothetical protein ABZ078_09025 [Streptomyces sp. NPDC006385]|uniref:hypothetical protein n=1 Tax=Streptomyces sp. NPDC006385 TaxID=3156761 RepID=UPI0033A45031